MTKDLLFEANQLSKEIDKTKELIQFLESKIAQYRFEPPTRMSGFSLYYDSNHHSVLNEVEVKLICKALRTRLGELSEEFKLL